MPSRVVRRTWMIAGAGVVLLAAVIGMHLFDRHEPDPVRANRLTTPMQERDAADASAQSEAPPEIVSARLTDPQATDTDEWGDEAPDWIEPDFSGGLDPAPVDYGMPYDIQSPARPFGLDIVAPVRVAGSDEASADFMENTLPDILDYIESNVVFSSEVELNSIEADPYNLILENSANVRVYFVGEEASYHNSIGMNYAGDAGSMLLFPDASTIASYFPDGAARQDYTTAEYPLMPGDFIDLGAAEDGSLLDLFIIPRGAQDASDAYVIDKTFNSDMESHVRILGVVDESFVVLGFEDQAFGGDRDYDDVIIAVEIGENNLDAISENLGL